jgi:hypothetical protein
MAIKATSTRNMKKERVPKPPSNSSAAVARRLGLKRPLMPRRGVMSILGYIALRVGGKQVFIELCRLSKHEPLIRLVRLWDRLSQSDRRYVSVDDLSEAAGISDGELLREVCATASRHGRAVAVCRILSAIEDYPEVTRAAFERALEPEKGRATRLRILRDVRMTGLS